MPAQGRTLRLADNEICSDDGAFARDVLEGLTRKPKSLPCRYFYDEEGSRLFRQITELPEYYLTRCESEILQTQPAANWRPCWPASVSTWWNWGPGTAGKPGCCWNNFSTDGLDFRYVPIDICEAAVRDLIGNLKKSLGSSSLRRPDGGILRRIALAVRTERAAQPGAVSGIQYRQFQPGRDAGLSAQRPGGLE